MHIGGWRDCKEEVDCYLTLAEIRSEDKAIGPET